jgi:hypothetical protein
MSTKRFIILLVLIPLLVIGTAVFFYFRQAQRPKTQVQEPKQESRLQEFAAEPVISPVLSFNGETVWFMTQEGKLYRKAVSGGGEKEEYVLPETLENPTDLIWQKTGSDFIVQENSGGHIRYRFFDSQAGSFTSYPEQMRQVRFVTDGSKIVYDWVTLEGKHELKLADKKGENFQKVADLFRSDYQFIASPVAEEVALFSSDSFEPSRIFLVNLLTGQFLDIGEKIPRQGLKFSPDGTKLLSSESTLEVYDLNSSEVVDTGVMADIERAEWGKNSDEIVIGTDTGIIKYNLADRSTTDLYKFQAEENIEPTSLLFHPTEPILFFVDKRTGYLYSLDLK